ncbi:MAG: hypothetical protein IH959_02425 [Chloroflexi bacterium]|nr:hypothetical protein [Chloroflexota bacterium]
MGRPATRARQAGLLLAVLLLVAGAGLLVLGADQVSETSSVAAAPKPTPTYVSELAPAVVLAPGEPEGLPQTGAAAGAATLWPKASGLGLALLGALLAYGALTLRPVDAN